MLDSMYNRPVEKKGSIAKGRGRQPRPLTIVKNTMTGEAPKVSLRNISTALL